VRTGNVAPALLARAALGQVGSHLAGVRPRVAPVHLELGGVRLPGIEGGHELEAHVLNRDWNKVCSILEGPKLPPDAGLPGEVAALDRQARCLRSLGALRDMVHQPWDEAPTAANLKQHLEQLGEAADVAGLSADLRLYLAERAQLEGRPELARQLLGGEPTPDAARMMRDLKVLGAAAPARPPGTRRPDSVLGLVPLPEPEPMGFRPAVREALKDGLPVLEELAAAEKQARAAVLERIEQKAEVHWSHLHIHLYRLHLLNGVTDRHDRDSRDADRKAQTAVAARLKRDLKPADCILVRQLLRQGKDTDEAVRILNELANATRE
jgi:hypothetical protein